MSDYHVSVLLDEAVSFLNVLPDGVYVDVTFGAGGHSREILNSLGGKGRLYAFDQDEDVKANLPVGDKRIELISANFRYFKRYLRLEGIQQVDGILADLGVSSHQFDEGSRGFSYRYDAMLDMRMNQESDITAAKFLETVSEDQLLKVLSEYGEVRNSKTLAHAIIQARKVVPIRTTFQLNRILEQNLVVEKHKYFAQVYQALRMHINDEIGALKDLLTEGLAILKPGGRFVVITFHSIEDRVVKDFFKAGNFTGEYNQDVFGKINRPFKLINKNVILPSSDELKRNSRARSAKLRVAEKV